MILYKDTVSELHILMTLDYWQALLFFCCINTTSPATEILPLETFRGKAKGGSVPSPCNQTEIPDMSTPVAEESPILRKCKTEKDDQGQWWAVAHFLYDNYIS